MTNEELRHLAPETRCVQAGYLPGNHDARIMPIVQSTTYKFDTAEDLGDAFDLKIPNPMYTRLGNPSLSWVEEKVAVLEGGVAALSTSSGQAANFFAVVNIAKAGDHVLAMSNLYGGTHTLFGSQLRKFGIDVEFVDPNLSLAKAGDVPLIVDNTFPSPVLCNPIEWGANIVTHSATKYLDGHATSVGGFIVDGGNFNWNNGKYPELTEPDADYHGIVYTDQFGATAYVAKARAGLLRDFGSTMSPFNAFLINLGIETLHLRMQRHSENALAVAEHLAQHPDVAWVNYPGLPSNPNYEKAQKYLPKGQSGVVSFGPKGGIDRARKVINQLGLATLVTHVGDLRSHVIHPASTTHRQLDEAALKAAGVAPDLIRFNVGIEALEDIIADVDQALAQTR